MLIVSEIKSIEDKMSQVILLQNQIKSDFEKLNLGDNEALRHIKKQNLILAGRSVACLLLEWESLNAFREALEDMKESKHEKFASYLRSIGIIVRDTA